MNPMRTIEPEKGFVIMGAKDVHTKAHFGAHENTATSTCAVCRAIDEADARPLGLNGSHLRSLAG